MEFTNMNTIQMINKINKHEDDIVNTNMQLADITTNVKTYGAKGNAYYYNSPNGKYYEDAGLTIQSSNDTIAIQNAIDYVASLGGGAVLIPRGTYLVDTIKLKSNVKLYGVGKASVLQQSWSATDHFITLSDYNQIHCKIEGLRVIGCRSRIIAYDLIHIDNNDVFLSGEVDHYHIIRDCTIESTDGNGIRMTRSRGLTVDNCWVRKCNKDGISINSSDNIIINCNVSLCANGYSTTDGASALRISNCKAFFNNIGFYFATPITPNYTQNVTLTGCETQSNALHGYYLENCLNCSFLGLIADADSRTNTTGIGFYIKNCEHIKLTGVFREKDSLYGVAPDNGRLAGAIKFEGTNKCVNVDITYDSQRASSKATKFISTDLYSDTTSYVKVNGEE
ncbi:right-handed parallel beta-helix repeat-containing protein [Clostridium gasigenes]|uniref:right-handed parallel beta-helix repeat-containing protein n=1 Tax=Clostridium gasigenes TaxID=94869 RepID=UPI001C0C1C57|nr:right-handed parallel beta-helix repeat-containing protein [Clostridium gasigenes]MBU3109898.1 glycoside hydrolase family 55 protein [Clostridium gasigenes]